MKKMYVIFILILTSNLLFSNSDFFNDNKVNNPLLTKAIELYQGLEFKKSREILFNIMDKAEDRLEKAIAIKYIAFSYTLGKNDDKAEKYYSLLFDIYPDFILDFDSVTPKVSEYFKDYHQTWLRTPNTKVKIYEIKKDKIKYDAGIKVDLEWHDPNLEVGYVIFKYKSQKESKFSQLEKRDIKAKNFIYSFDLSFLNDPTIDFMLEYYLEIYDYDGNLMFKVKDEKNPSLVKIDVPGGALVNDYNKKPDTWYTSAWFITTTTVLLVGAIGGGAYYYFSNQDTTNGDPQNAKINIYITNSK